MYIEESRIGINLLDQSLIFKWNERVESFEKILKAGFEIGLYLSSEILQHHSGKLFVEDVPGKGSNFISLCQQQEQVKL